MKSYKLKIEEYEEITRTTQQHGPISELIGMRFTHVESGKTTFELITRNDHYNRGGSVQGGILCAMADASMGFAFGSLLEYDDYFTSIELKINFLRPVFEQDHLIAFGNIIHKGKRTGVGECKIYFKKEGKNNNFDSCEPVAIATSSLILIRESNTTKKK